MIDQDYYHTPVLLPEVIDGLRIQKDEVYVDCNLGGGGHTSEILRNGGTVIGIDMDNNAVDYCYRKFKNEIKNGSLIIVNENFGNISQILMQRKVSKVSGILFDLGVSTFQLKDENKGFSYEDDGKLDMRMSDTLSVTADDLIRGLSQKELERLFLEYGEEPQSKLYSKAIKELVKNKDQLSARDVSEAIIKSSKYQKSKTHPATRVFQALRIAVNSELENLRKTLNQAIPLLKPEGRLVIISFHSLEDKLAKEIAGSPDLRKINDKPTVPSEDEISLNPSSRSAKLRIYEKI